MRVLGSSVRRSAIFIALLAKSSAPITFPSLVMEKPSPLHVKYIESVQADHTGFPEHNPCSVATAVYWNYALVGALVLRVAKWCWCSGKDLLGTG